MELLVGLVIAVLCALIVFLWQESRPKLTVTGPPCYPFIGNSVQILRNLNTLLEFLTLNCKTYGHVWKFKIPFGVEGLVVTHPDNLEHFLKTNFHKYEKGPDFHEKFVDLLGDGIFNVDGEAWKVQRKTASKVFNIRNFKDNMSVVFSNHIRTFMSILNARAKDQAEFDLSDLFFRFTLDSIGEIAFGMDLHALQEVLQPGQQQDSKTAFAKAFDESQIVLNKRQLVPCWKLLSWLTPAEYKLRKNVELMNAFAKEVIEKRRTDPNLQQRSDLLSLFMSNNYAKSSTASGESEDKHLRDVILNFIIAGRDTTAQALSWSIYLLCKNPEKMAKAVEEVDKLTGDVIDFEGVKGLKYAHAVISETLRLQPSVPKDAKMCMEDDVFPDGTQVKKGVYVLYVPYAMGRLTDLWGDNAEEFVPERWLVYPNDPDAQAEVDEEEETGAQGAGEVKLRKVSPFKFPAFQAGPRTCLGQNMAYLEAKMVLANLLRHYSFQLCPSHVVSYENAFTLPMKNGLKVTVTRRQPRLQTRVGA